MLLGRVSVSDVVQEWGLSGLHVLPSGPIPPNPSELPALPPGLACSRSYGPQYDYVVLDAPPLLPVADAAILSTSADGTVVVANVTRVRRHQLVEALRSVSQVNGRVLGVVMNQVRRHVESYEYRAEDVAAQPSAPRPAGPAGAPRPMPGRAAEAVGQRTVVAAVRSAVRGSRGRRVRAERRRADGGRGRR